MGLSDSLKRLRQNGLEQSGVSGSRSTADHQGRFASLQVGEPIRKDSMMSQFSSQALDWIQSGKGGENTGAGIIRSISELAGIDIENAAKVVDGFWGYVAKVDHYKSRGSWNNKKWLRIPKFGSFYVYDVYPRMGTNPKTGEDMKMGGYKKLSFKLSPSLSLEDLKRRYSDGITPHRSSIQWVAQWRGKGRRHLSRKRQISVYIHEVSGLPLEMVPFALECLLDLILARVCVGPVTFRKRGSFFVRNFAARMGTNPKTGEDMKLPARKVVRFRTYTGLWEQIQKTS